MARPIQQQLVVRKRSKMFHRELLPPALSFWEGEFGSLGRGGKSWRRVLCPFHRDHHPSLSVNAESGGFYCFACGAKGGDLVAYVMLRDGVDFKAAAQMLGAWRQARDTPQERLEWIGQERKRDRIRLAADRLECAERELRLRIRSELHSLERVQSEILGRLQALNRGAQENTLDEAEVCWNVLSLLVDEIRELVAAFYLVAFSLEEQRCTFVLFPERRADAIHAVLTRGGLIDDRGRWLDVPID
jgi:hypothetical protein